MQHIKAGRDDESHANNALHHLGGQANDGGGPEDRAYSGRHDTGCQQNGVDADELDEDQRLDNRRKTVPGIERARDEAVGHHLAQFQIRGRGCKGADAERVEEIRGRTEANRFEIKTQLALCTRRTEHRNEVNGARQPKQRQKHIDDHKTPKFM